MSNTNGCVATEARRVDASRFFYQTVCAIGFGVFLLVGCGAESIDVSANFDSIQSEVFDRSCASSSCHGDSKAGGLDLRSGTSYSNLVGVKAQNAGASGLLRVDVDNPERSFLLIKLTSPDDSQGARMPLGGGALDDTTVDTIRQWIVEGAKQ